MYELTGKKVWVAGHRGMVGSAVVRRLASENCEVIVSDRSTLDLRNQAGVQSWLELNRPDCVVLAAATVGGINANNSFPVHFLQDNLLIQTNVLKAAFAVDVERLLFLGSSCIYPRLAAQPIQENSLLSGPLEPTNEWYAVAKIAGLKLCQAYRRQYGKDWISAMPTNLYGPGDNYDLSSSHVLPALLRKFHEAKSSNHPRVEIWGSGRPMREFLHCDDLADALIFLLKNYSDDEHVNVGSGSEISINELANLIAQVVGFEGELLFDSSKPDGTPRKLLDTSKLSKLGWASARDLRTGVTETYTHWLADG